MNILKRENVDDDVRMKSYITVVLNMSLHVGGESSTISVDCHRVLCLPYTARDKLAVADVNSLRS